MKGQRNKSLAEEKGYNFNDIAIVGISLKFPEANNIQTFWENIKNGKESIRFYSDEELIESNISKELISNPDFVKTSGGILENKEYFDSLFFNLTPQEALIMDPQIRLMMETCYNALEDAGYKTDNQKLSIGLFVGASSNLYWEILTHVYARESRMDEFFLMNLSKKDFIGNWIAYKLNLRGPVVSLQSACSTSLVGVDMACQSLKLSQCDIAVVGAVSLSSLKKKGYIHYNGMVYSSDGHCRAFDKDATGIVAGEGVAAIVLRRLDDALKERDNIYAVIKGCAVNNDGDRKMSYYAPSQSGQAEVIIKAIKNANIETGSINYIETHGTGTPIGDPIEFEALKRVFGREKKQCALGSIKPNIGHLDVCAGLAGLIKAVLVLKNKTIPPLINFENLNPKINLNDSPFSIHTKPVHKKDLKRAGISSFGMGGTNSHVIIEEWCDETIDHNSREYKLIMLSAKSELALNRKLEDIKNYLISHPVEDISNISFTLLKGRNNYPFKASFVCQNKQDAIDIINLNDDRRINYNYDSYYDKSVIFVFSGQGTQYLNMGLDLYKNEPYFRKIVDDCCEIIKNELQFNLLDIIYSSDKAFSEQRINQQDVAQPLLFIFEFALAKLLMLFGIKPKAMIGYSIGEYVAACLSNVMQLKDALKLVVSRGLLMQSVPEGLMLSVPLSENEVQPYLNNGVSLAVVNGISCIVSGETKTIIELEAALIKNRIMPSRLKISHAGHSSMMDGLMDEFLAKFSGIELSEPEIPFISNVTGNFINKSEAISSQYWVKQLRQTVRFSEGIETLLKLDSPVFIEIGPGQDISALIKRFTEGLNNMPLVINTIRHQKRDISDQHFLFLKLAQLVNHNIDIDPEGLFYNETLKKISLPEYPFERERYCIDGDLDALSSGGSLQSISVKADITQTDPTYWKKQIRNNANLSSEYAPANNETERRMQEFWCDFFKVKDIGINDNFFELGGDSLKAINLINLLHLKFDSKINLVDFFQNPTIKETTLLISKNSKESFKGLKKAEKKEYYALSSAQKRIYTAQAFDKNSTVYNMPQFCLIEGEFDHDKISAIFNKIVSRHECYSTAFVLINDAPFQMIKSVKRIEIKIFYSDEKNYKSIAHQFVKPFDLSQPPLMRVGVIILEERKYVLMVDVHHIISDLLSSSLLIEEFMKLYRNENIESQVFQYKDYSEWQLSLIKSDYLKKQEEFWLNEFKDVPYLNLPLDFPRTNIFSYEGKTIKFNLDSDKCQKLKLIANENGSTVFMVLLSVYYILLAKICNQNDIVIGSPATGRRHVDLLNVMGKFVNMLPIRCSIDLNYSFTEFLINVKNKVIAVMDFQDYQYDHLVFKLGQNNDYSRNPLFNVAFSYVNTQSELSQRLNINEQNGLHIKSLEAVEYSMSKFDMVLNASVASNDIDFILEYSTKLFKKQSVEDFSFYYLDILEQIISNKNILLKDITVNIDLNEITNNPYSSEPDSFSF